MARTTLIKNNLLVGFYHVLSTKKLHFLFLPVVDSITGGEDVIVRTASNDTSISKFMKMDATMVGMVFMLIPANTTCTPLLKKPSFTSAEALNLVAYLPEGYTTNKFKLVAFHNIFPIPHGSVAIKGDLSKNSIGDALWNIQDPAGPNWIQF